MAEFVAAQEARIDGLLCRIIKQDKPIERLQKQVEEYATPRPTLIAQAQDALTLLARNEAGDSEDRNAPVAARTRHQRYEAAMPSSSLSPPPSRVSLPPSSPDPSLPATPPASVRSISPLLPSSSTPISAVTQLTSEKMERAIDFGMSALSTPFCQYGSCAFFVQFG